MSTRDYFLLAALFVAFLISTEAGFFLIVRYRTRLAFWCGLLLLSLAVELGCYLLQWVNAASFVVQFLSFLQLVSYTLVCIFWLLFALSFSRHSSWIRPRTLALVIGIPCIYLLLAAGRWMNGLAVSATSAEAYSSLMFSPLTVGPARTLFLAYAYGIAILSFIVLLEFYSRSNAFVRKWTLPLLSGPVILCIAATLELAGINPSQPISIHQLGCAVISVLAFFVVFDLRFGSLLANAREIVVDQMQDGVLILDPQDRVVDLNPSVRQIIGPNSAHAAKHQLSDIWPAGARVIADRSGRGLSAGAASIVVDGQEFSFDINVSQLIDVYREPIGRVVVLRNITGRERLEKALHERAQELLRANTFLAALAEVNLALQTTTDPSRINTILGSELQRLGLVCFIAQLEPGAANLTIRYFSAQQELAAQIEKLLGIKVNGFRLDQVQFARLYQILETRAPSFRPYQPDDLNFGPGKIPAVVLEQVLRWCGLKTDTAALILPLVTAERTLGLMGVWGRSLSEADIAPFEVFGSQVAHVMERAILYETEVRRSSELARANGLVLGLATVASVLGTTSDSGSALDVLGQELSRAGMRCAVVAFDAAAETATIQHLSLNPEAIQAIESLIGRPLIGYAIPKRDWPGDTVSRGRIPVWYPHPDEIYRPMFPSLSDTALKQVYPLLGFSDEDQLCVLPLVSGEHVMGAIGIWGSSLQPSDSPMLSIFAGQVSSILQNVALYEKEILRTRELARSNAMVMALSRVAARLDTTSDLSQVFETLGSELKNVHVHCMVGTLNDAQQAMKIEYLSVAPDVSAWADRMGSILPKEIIVPRRLWPTDKAITERVPYWDPNPVGSASQMFPFVPKPVFVKTLQLAGVHPEAPMCYLPMISEEQVLGILAVWGPDLRQDDIPGLSVFANQVATAIRNTRLYQRAQQEIAERTQAEARTQEALQEKEVLLKEVHHRVKNNLQVISSLLSLQSRAVSDPHALDSLRDSQNRVRSMALVHEKLYSSSSLARIDFGEYAYNLTSQLFSTYAAQAGTVTPHVRVDSCWLDVDTAVPCGLILNELVSNALKYAFPNGREGQLDIAVRSSGAGRVQLRVGDDGVGFPASVDFRRTSTLGLQLVNTLVDQIGGTIQLETGAGTRFFIEFTALHDGA